MKTPSERDDSLHTLKQQIIDDALALGFDDCRVAPVDDESMRPYVANHQAWVAGGYHGDMDYMVKHGRLRESPGTLEVGTVRAIVVRMDYLPEGQEQMWSVLDNPEQAYISRYAVGRDYHKVMRNALQKLAKRIAEGAGDFGYRAFVDSAPVMEKPLAELAGLGWIGKHTNVINSKGGSWFFLGELLVDLPLPSDERDLEPIFPAGFVSAKSSTKPSTKEDRDDREPLPRVADTPTGRLSHCGSCARCLDVCPTGAIIAPYTLDARRCISYLTIEYHGSIPEPLRPLMGNRIYGCDDCQLVCPWNKFAKVVDEARFQTRRELFEIDLLALLAWDEATFLRYFEGSPIRRIGWHSWQRNIAIALGNVPKAAQDVQQRIIQALSALPGTGHAVLDEAREWAIQQQRARQ